MNKKSILYLENYEKFETKKDKIYKKIIIVLFMKLNNNEKRLLVELFKNARLSNRKLSSSVLMSKETVGKKIDEFEKNNIIKGYKLKINYSKLDFKKIELFIKLKKANSKIIEEIKDFLIEHNNSTWISHCLGKFDFKVSFEVKKIEHTNSIINELRQKFPQYIDIVESVIVTDISKFNPKLFLGKLLDNKKIPEEFLHLEKAKERVKISESKDNSIDYLDKQIIYELGKNARKKTLVEIAQKLNVNAELVKNRLKNLEKKEIINGYSIIFEGKKFNKIWGLMLLTINSSKIEELKKFLERKNYLSNYIETLGHYNFQITYFAEDVEEMYQSLNEIREHFSEDIFEYEHLLYFNIYKSTQVPTCIFE